MISSTRIEAVIHRDGAGEESIWIKMEPPSAGFKVLRTTVQTLRTAATTRRMPPYSNVKFAVQIAREVSGDLRSPFGVRLVLIRKAEVLFVSEELLAELELAFKGVDLLNLEGRIRRPDKEVNQGDEPAQK